VYKIAEFESNAGSKVLLQYLKVDTVYESALTDDDTKLDSESSSSEEEGA
jgi:hypothetical protein